MLTPDALPANTLPISGSGAGGGTISESGAGDGAVVSGARLVATSDLLNLVAGLDFTNAGPATLQTASKILSVATGATVCIERGVPKKRSDPVEPPVPASDVEEEDLGEKKSKKQKRLQKELGEHTTRSTDLSKIGRGVFETPIGKRSTVPVKLSAPARHAIRTGRQHQADIPPFDPSAPIPDRADEIIECPIAHDDKDKLAFGLKKRRPCGTPGCMLPDHHAGPHSNEASLLPRRISAQDRHEADHPADDEVTVTHVKSDKRAMIVTKNENGVSCFGGSTPALVKMNARRANIIDSLKTKHGADFGGDGAGIDQVSDHFIALMLASGYKEGTFDPKTNYQNKDGNVYKYPGYLRKFMEAGIFNVRSDFFLPGAKAKATKFAEKYGFETSKRSPKYGGMTDKQKAALARKLQNDVMHGFDDFVKLSSTV